MDILKLVNIIELPCNHTPSLVSFSLPCDQTLGLKEGGREGVDSYLCQEDREGSTNQHAHTATFISIEFGELTGGGA